MTSVLGQQKFGRLLQISYRYNFYKNKKNKQNE
jgi:hypothetical protein